MVAVLADLASSSSLPRRPVVRGPLPGPRAAQILAGDERAFSTTTTTTTTTTTARVYPLVVASGEGVWVTDVDGNQFLDFAAGMAGTGADGAHRRVVVAPAQKQPEHAPRAAGTGASNEVAVRLATRLATLSPIGQGGARVFLCNSGTEAVEEAMKLARRSTGRPNLIAFFGASHGRTLGSLTLVDSMALQRYRPSTDQPGVYRVPFPSLGKGGWRAEESLRRIEKLFATVTPPESVAAIFVEPVQGEGGCLVPPDDFLPRLRELSRRHGILLVADELQSGMGRTGRMFAAEEWGICPDVVTLGMGNDSGLQMGAVIARSDLVPEGTGAAAFDGDPGACVAAMAAVDRLQKELMGNAASMGRVLLAGLQRLSPRYPQLISGVRGKGLMVGLEMARPGLQDALVQLAFRRGLLLLPVGRQTVGFSPALTLSESEIGVALEIVDGCLAGLSREG